jgi:peroxiredoxin
MAVTPSNMLPLGTKAFDFSLPDVVAGKQVRLGDFASRKALLVMFISRHCPYVKHVQNRLTKLAQDYAEKDIGIMAISSNDASAYPDDGPDSLKEMAIALCFMFPLCHDETQKTAKAYKAACTPDFFLFNKKRKLVYRGQFDDSRPGNGLPVTGRDLCTAIDAVLGDKPVSQDQKPSVGCNIKWKPGNEPK